MGLLPAKAPAAEKRIGPVVTRPLSLVAPRCSFCRTVGGALMKATEAQWENLPWKKPPLSFPGTLAGVEPGWQGTGWELG